METPSPKTPPRRRQRRSQAPASLSTVLLAATALTAAATPAAAMLQCDKIVAGGHRFDFTALGGPHSVTTWQDRKSHSLNTTYTLDLCAPLKKPKGEEFCDNGARVCAIGRLIDSSTNNISAIIPIAGDLRDRGMGDLDPSLTRLKDSESSADSKKEGVRIVLNGGRFAGVKQKAIIEMLCSRTLTGLEGEWKPSKDEEKKQDVKRGEGMVRDLMPAWQDLATAAAASAAAVEDGGDKDPADDEDEIVEHQFLEPDAALIFDSYEPLANDAKTKVLRLTWHTKYACESTSDEDVPDDESGNKKSSWGFFTWLFIIAFLATASYIIFGSWLNYSRHGARGWDLLPHGDTLRDIPYLLKDWIRSVLNTVQSSGSRGGYSSV